MQKNRNMMKKFILLLSLLASCGLTSFAQSKYEFYVEKRNELEQSIKKYLTVKGLELKPGLKMDDALRYFESKGFSKTEYFDYAKETFNIYDLEGSFFNYSKCGVKISPLNENKNIVSMIAIHFPDADSFKRLKEEYDELKASLSEKYYLIRNTESFDDDYVNRSTSDYLKLNALSNNECKFESTFYISENPYSFLLGQIILSIATLKVDYHTTYYVSLLYITPDSALEYTSAKEDDL